MSDGQLSVHTAAGGFHYCFFVLLKHPQCHVFMKNKKSIIVSLSCFSVLAQCATSRLKWFYRETWRCRLSGICFRCVQEYVRLIGPWCQVNIGSCRFMLGQCYLANGEGQKVSQEDLPDWLRHYCCCWCRTCWSVTPYPLSSSGSAVFPGGSDRGGEGGVPHKTDRQRGGGGGGGYCVQSQIKVLQQGTRIWSSNIQDGI